MITFSLQSGSNGNCIYVEAGKVRLLFDAGIPGSLARRRMEQHARSIRDLTALIISHDHHDHVNSAGAFHRLFHMPLYLTEKTWRAAKAKIGRVSNLMHFDAGQTLCFGDVLVHTLPTPHDAVDGVAFVVEHEDRRLGIFTDLGNPFAGLRRALATVHAAYLESNYDPHMLATGDYPEDLKQRIRGERGHISNQEAAELLAARGAPLRWAALAHLSERNNHPDVALKTHRGVLGGDYPLLIAGRFEPSPVLEV